MLAVPTNIWRTRDTDGARLAGMRVQARRIRTEGLVRLSIIKTATTHSCDTVPYIRQTMIVDRSCRTHDK